MKNLFVRTLFLINLLLLMTPQTKAQSYNSLWKQVQQAQDKGLPQTVIKLTDQIARKAEQEKNAGQLLNAVLCGNEREERLTPDSFYVHLQAMEQWAARTAEPAEKAILHSLLAERYADYLDNNRYALRGRTEIDVDADEVPQDMREWSARLIIDKILTHAQASLHNPAWLAQTSVLDYRPLVIEGQSSRAFRHGLLHLLAQRALTVYAAVGRFDDTYRSLEAAQAEQLYTQVLLPVYRDLPQAEEALLLATLDYEDWKLDNVDTRPGYAYQARRTMAVEAQISLLDKLMRTYADVDACAEVYLRKARLLMELDERNRAEALRLCDTAIARYPRYACAGELKNLRETILQPRLRVSFPGRSYPGEDFAMEAHYANLSGMTVKIYRTRTLQVNEAAADYGDVDKLPKLQLISSTRLDLKPAAGTGVDAHGDSDAHKYADRDSLLRVKTPAEPGCYVVQVVPDVPVKSGRREALLYVSRLKVLALHLPQGQADVLVLDALSGQPVPEAKLETYTEAEYRKYKSLQTYTTDADGRVQLKTDARIDLLVAVKDDDRVVSRQSLTNRPADTDRYRRMRPAVTLLTDRSIYRPGQTIRLKGIVYEQNDERAQVLSGRETTVRLLDVNRQEMAKQTLKTNDYGSFATQFALPQACLNGQFTIAVEGYGSTWVRVEEYKRPSFEIVLDELKAPYRLGDAVALTGAVKQYSGASAQGVPVSFVVKRFDDWGMRLPAEEKPLTADTVTTDAEGRFALTIHLQAPDQPADALKRVVAGADVQRSYRFNIAVKAVNEAGETQETQYDFRAADRAYSMGVRDMDSWVCKDETVRPTFEVTNRAGVRQAVKGTYRLLYLPDEVIQAKARRTDALTLDERYALTPDEWKQARPVVEAPFTPNEPFDWESLRTLPSGNYRLSMIVTDSCGRSETEERAMDFVLFSKQDKQVPGLAPFFAYQLPHNEVRPGEKAVCWVGSSLPDVYMRLDLFTAEGRVESRPLRFSRAMQSVEIEYKETYGKRLVAQVVMVKDDCVYTRRFTFRRPEPKRDLQMQWQVFRDKLRPGQQEEWRLTLKNPDGTPAQAELLAMMYDASLDAVSPLHQRIALHFPTYFSNSYWTDERMNNRYIYLEFARAYWKVPSWQFDRFYDPRARVENAMLTRSNKLMAAPAMAHAKMALAEDAVFESEEEVAVTTGAIVEAAPAAMAQAGYGAASPTPAIRSNFNETAFFYPQLRTNEQGEVVFSFVMPQSVTRWNFRGYSHDRQMQAGMLSASVVTAKELMLTPNMPRYVRVGDHTKMAATVANLTAQSLKGVVRVEWFDPMSEQVIKTQKEKITIPAGRNAVVTFDYTADERFDLLGVRLVAEAGNFSDGEQHILPVLSDKQFVTEAVTMPLRGNETRTFDLDELFNRHAPSATHRRLTVEMTGNPAWLAVQALPAMALPQSENAIDWAVALYANRLAHTIAHSHPHIQAVVNNWRMQGGDKESFLSQLEKNVELKNMILSESPWVMEANNETEQRRRIATLFDVNTMADQTTTALTKLRQWQGTDGAWSWYKGMPSSHSVTLFVTKLLIRMEALTDAPAPVGEMKQAAWKYLHARALETYRMMKKAERDGHRPTVIPGTAEDYLYLLAIDGKLAPDHADALSAEERKVADYFLKFMPRVPETGSIKSKAQTAIVLHAAGKTGQAAAYVASIKEHLVTTPEMGAHFAFNDNPWAAWGMWPISVHVDAMEALWRTADDSDRDEVNALLDEMKIWLLKQKQTTLWPQTVVTADALYALLCQGVTADGREAEPLLSNTGQVKMTIGKEQLSTGGTIGLSYTKHSFGEDSDALKATRITVSNEQNGIAWGAVYAQYLSPLSDIRRQGKELQVEKQLFVERLSAEGKPTLQPIQTGTRLQPGDKVVSRLVIRADRKFDFVHLKDSRGACFEPIGQLSGYRWNQGIGYYVEIKDAATNFFFDSLGKGVYVLEHSYRIARAGSYQAGLATIQCAYAPEMAGHSATMRVEIE